MPILKQNTSCLQQAKKDHLETVDKAIPNNFIRRMAKVYLFKYRPSQAGKVCKTKFEPRIGKSHDKHNSTGASVNRKGTQNLNNQPPMDSKSGKR